MAEVKCYFCENKVDKKVAIKADKKNFHPQCYQNYLDKKDCCDYICSIFNLKAPGPRIYSQLSTFISQKNYSYKNIKLALKYWYEVKKQSREKAGEGIGIVPYIYDEAVNYFKELENKQKNQSLEIQKYIEKEKNKEHIIITTTSGKPNKNKANKYELY